MIYHGYHINKTDDLNWQVQFERTVTKSKKPELNGTVKLDTVGWYPNFEQAAIDVVRLIVDSDPDATAELKTYIDRYREVTADFIAELRRAQ